MGCQTPPAPISTPHDPLECSTVYQSTRCHTTKAKRNATERRIEVPQKQIRLDCRWPGDSYWQKWKKNDTQYPIGGSQMRSYSLSGFRSPLSVYLCATRPPTRILPPKKKSTQDNANQMILPMICIRFYNSCGENASRKSKSLKAKRAVECNFVLVAFSGSPAALALPAAPASGPDQQPSSSGSQICS